MPPATKGRSRPRFSGTRRTRFFLDRILRDWVVQSFFYHCLDGQCLLSRMSSEDEGYEEFVLAVAAMSFAVVSWLATTRAWTAEVWFVCATGKHHSMFVAQCCFAVLRTLLADTQQRGQAPQIDFLWASAERACAEADAAEADAAEAGRDQTAARPKFRQQGHVVKEARRGLHSYL